MNFSVKVCLTLILFTNFKNFQVAAVDPERKAIIDKYFDPVIRACLTEANKETTQYFWQTFLPNRYTADIVDMAKKVKDAIASYDLKEKKLCVKTIRGCTASTIDAMNQCQAANLQAQRRRQEPNNAAIWKTRFDNQGKNTCNYVKEIYEMAFPITVHGAPEPLSTKDMFDEQC